METYKANGRRGYWFATINGEEVPCAWSWWQRGNPNGGFCYFDPGARPGTRQWDKYVDAIKQGGKVALTGKKEVEAGRWERDGYIALYAVANVKTTETSLSFDMTERLALLE